MRQAGFRVLGFGVENFALNVLKEFNKAQIHPLVSGVLETALALGITPFLDLILTSPRCRLEDLAETIGQAYRWTLAGCEVGMYPYVIPFSGAAMARDPALRPHTIMTRHRVAGTGISWEQPSKIPPIDPSVRTAILRIEAEVESRLAALQRLAGHLPSRVRSLLWIVCAIPILAGMGQPAPDFEEAVERLVSRLPRISVAAADALRRELRGTTWKTVRLARG